MQRKSNSTKQFHEDHCIFEDYFRPKYIISGISLITTSNLTYLEKIFFYIDLISIYMVIFPYVKKLIKTHKFKLTFSKFTFLRISTLYLFLLRVKIDSLGLIINIADIFIVISSAISWSFLYTKLLSIFSKTILNNIVFWSLI